MAGGLDSRYITYAPNNSRRQIVQLKNCTRLDISNLGGDLVRIKSKAANEFIVPPISQTYCPMIFHFKEPYTDTLEVFFTTENASQAVLINHTYVTGLGRAEY